MPRVGDASTHPEDVARAALGELWTAPHAYARVAEILRQMFPAAGMGSVYDWTPEGALGECGHTLDRSGVGWGALRVASDDITDAISSIAGRLYSPTPSSDPFRNRAVTTGELFRDQDPLLLECTRTLFKPLGQHYQLRLMIYERGRRHALAALGKEERGGDFTRQDAARLDSVSRALRDALAAARALGLVPAGNTAIGRVLDAFDAPAFLTTQTGAIAHANPAARAGYPRRPGWLNAVLRSPQRHLQTAAVTRVDHEGRSLFLVIPRRTPAPAGDSALPPSLQRVAALAVAGLSDKEIAGALGVPLPTVRTYMGRIYKTLRVHSRLGLAAALRGRIG